MKTRKILSNIIRSGIATSLVVILSAGLAVGQDLDMTYDGLEKKQDKVEKLNVKVFHILEKYPGAIYHYVYKDDDVSGVFSKGITDAEDKKHLEGYLIELDDLRDDILNMSNRVGIFYVSETDPKPKMGYEDFYDKLHRNLTYPEDAEDRGVEGTVFVKFVLDADGKVEHVKTANDIEDSYDWIVDDLEKEAKQAIKSTSGDWIPAKIGGVAVSQLMVVPVQFKLESPYVRPIF